MTQGLHPLAANMINQLNRVDVISNNLANANTTGFKGDNLVEGSFNNYLDKAEKKGEKPLKLSEVMNTIPKIDGDFMDTQLGSITKTGNRLDFALNQRDVFFKVQNPNGNIEYTRDGSFKILNGDLVTQNGYKVLDEQNQGIVVGEDDLFLDNIALVRSDFNNLDKIGNNNYKANDINQVQNVDEPRNKMLQGAIEQSNVNSIKSMVGLIEAQRKFEQAQKAMNGIDQINQKVIDSIGNNR